LLAANIVVKGMSQGKLGNNICLDLAELLIANQIREA
jgi:hypothetical protein